MALSMNKKQAPIQIAGKNKQLTNRILSWLKEQFSAHGECQFMSVQTDEDFIHVLDSIGYQSFQKQRKFQPNQLKIVIINSLEQLAKSANGLIYLDYFLERTRFTAIFTIIRSTTGNLTRLLTDIAGQCNTYLISEFFNQQELELLAQPNNESSFPKDIDSSFIIRQLGTPPRLHAFKSDEKDGDNR